MARRVEVTGAGGLPLTAWEYADESAPALGPESQAALRPAVLLLHGLMGRASQWAGTARRLAGGHRVVALDQRGHGRSGKPEGPYSREAYVADAAAVIEQLGLAPATVVGHSMGALTACQLAARRPSLVRAVALCDMRAAAPGEASRRRWEEWFGAWPLPFASLDAVRRWFGEDDPWLEGARPARGRFFAEVMEERADGWRPEFEARHMLRSREPWINDAHWDELARVSCPALVVRGWDGELGRAEAQEMVRVLPRGSYAEIPDAGHLVPWDQPEAWYTAIEAFLADVAGVPV